MDACREHSEPTMGKLFEQSNKEKGSKKVPGRVLGEFSAVANVQ